MKRHHCAIFLLVICLACQSRKAEPPRLFSLMDSTGIDFDNVVKDGQIENSFYFRNYYNGGGVAVGDISGDGLPDVLLTSNMGANKLYVNRGNFRFEDITARSGFRQEGMWSTGVVMVDIDGDGWLDIYECNSGNMKSGLRRNKLYINQHDLTFREASKAYGLDISGYCTQASFFDYDMDGDLDCFLINNSPIPFSSLNYAGMRDVDINKWKIDENLKGGGNHLYQNNSGHFTEVTAAAGLHSGLISFGLGVSVGDINGDGYADIYVGNDFIEKDYLYINQKNGTFRDEMESCMQKISMSSMSSDLADINNDGYPEIFTTDMIPENDYRLKTTGTFDNIDLYLSKQKAGLYHQYVKNCLQLNNGNGSFSEVANFSGVSATDWSWGALFFDADNDGLNDIYVCNGINKDLGDLDFLEFFSNDVYNDMQRTGRKAELNEILAKIPVTPLKNRVFRNEGNLSFTDVGDAWGFGQKSFSNSVAYGDLDGDGDLDLVVNNENGPSFVYRNNARVQNGHHYVSVLLKAAAPNTFAVGGRIKLYAGGQVLLREVVPSRGFQSSVDYRQTIGLGTRASIDSMVVIWPDRTFTKYDRPAIDRAYVLEQPSGRGQPAFFADASAPSSSALLMQASSSVMERHVEDDYVDFYYERNLPELLSRQGPHVARGDVDGDGLEDVYVCGARDQEGQLYLQTPSGGFARKREAVFKAYADFEDVAPLLFDADGDGDLDLFIGSGGNRDHAGARELQHRLYKNDGSGHFAIDGLAFPENSMNISVAAASDWDGDGDQDLFVGGRSVPFSYGSAPQSYLYQNDGMGHFTDVTQKLCAPMANVGMVTAALWADVSGDKRPELVITGCWMATRVFGWNGGSFTEVRNTGLENLHGWWQSIGSGDVNGDGKTDLVIGNVGENFYLRPDAGRPVKLWVRDFDGNGTVEQFMTRTVEGRDVPVFLKREIIDQFPALKKENLKHADYATKSINDLFSRQVLSEALQLRFDYCSSVVAINEGGGRFRVEVLPVMVQLSSVNAVCFAEVDGDGRTDLILGGNMFGFPPQFGRLDGSYGHVLKGLGDGSFAWVGPKASGLSVRGEIRDIQTIKGKANRQQIIITQNNEAPILFSLHHQKAGTHEQKQ